MDNTRKLTLLKFPEVDPVLSRLLSVEEMLYSIRELNDADLNLDFCLTSIQSCIDSYSRFSGVSFTSEESNTTSNSEG
jgi:hypothetical protein